LELTKTNVSTQPKAKTRTKTKNSQCTIAMAIPLTDILQRVVRHTNIIIPSLVRKNIGAATPNANVGGAMVPSRMQNGSRSSVASTKREKLERTIRKQRTRVAPHQSSKSHRPIMLVPLEMISPALFKGICS